MWWWFSVAETLELDDMLGGERLADPYPHFAEMLRDNPVHWNERYQAWFLHKHADVLWALRHPAFSSDRVRPVFETHLSEEKRAARAPTFEVLRHWMVFLDPPEHTRLRKLVMPAFSPKRVATWRPRVEQVVKETLATLENRQRFDFVTDFAYPIPAIVVAELIGVPAEDRDMFKKWSDDILTLVFGAQGEPGRRERAQQGLIELTGYLADLIARIRENPGDDVISSLVTAHDVDPPLDDKEIISTCALLVFGGHETTTNLIANGTRQLLLHPDQWRLLRDEPERIGTAVEELLRFDGPSRLEQRLLAEDVELRGTTLRKGDNVFLVQSAANRDPEVFERPHELDITRQPNQHVGFGFGVHHCLGNFLARLEAQIAFPAVLDAMPDLALDGPEEWHTTMMSRGMKTMPVRRGDAS
ncbi:Cytochrome P450 [Prauserella marina]|uniref:Cytochrome P450 n=1 Tax=Prauserella marina TaxID=530584 RepID=A0A1G6TR83_9PSEU|nr:cytochrome P450 [Prauserella marina]SDD30986.1 Cytochrome P450 [Prauserella marina]